MRKHIFNDMMNDTSKSFMSKTQMLSTDDLVEHPLNDVIYPHELYDNQMDSLVLDVNEKGIIQSIEVRKLSNDTYEILGGHRRVKALQINFNNTGDEKFKTVPAIVHEDMSDEEALDRLIISNDYRDKTEFSRMKEVEYLQTNYEQRKKRGEPISGSIRSLIARKLNLSETQAGTYQRIVKKAIPEVKEKVSSGELSIKQASTIAALTPQEQKKAVKNVSKKINIDDRIEIRVGTEVKSQLLKIAGNEYEDNLSDLIRDILKDYIKTKNDKQI